MPLKQPELPTIWRVPDALWSKIAPTLVVNKPRQKPGRPRSADRPLFDALIHLARTGMQWAVLPNDFPPKSTVHDRLQDWLEYGCLEAAWAVLLKDNDDTLGMEWQWQAADGCIVKAPLGKRTAEGDAQATGAPIPQTAASLVQNVICSLMLKAFHLRLCSVEPIVMT